MTFEQETDLLCVYLYDLIRENIVADGHLLSSRDSDKLQICAERLSAQANLIEYQAKKIEQQDKEIQRLRELITLLVENLHEDDDGPDAPGHSHEIPGIWDEDNGELSGKACQWCEIWGQALAVAYPNRPASSNADRL